MVCSLVNQELKKKKTFMNDLTNIKIVLQINSTKSKEEKIIKNEPECISHPNVRFCKHLFSIVVNSANLY